MPKWIRNTKRSDETYRLENDLLVVQLNPGQEFDRELIITIASSQKPTEFQAVSKAFQRHFGTTANVEMTIQQGLDDTHLI